MCDDFTAADNAAALHDTLPLSRRRFTILGSAGALALLLPPYGATDDVIETDVEVPTADGMADCYFAHPAAGVHAGVIVWPDILGLRPAFRAMGRRLAAAGYAVLVVNPYYRSARAPVVPAGATYQDAAIRARVQPLAATLSAATHATDARACAVFLDQQPATARQRPLGTMGYCMGGPMALRTAAALPARVGAVASFHGARLVTDAADSPHRSIPQLRGRFLIAIAENDDEREPAVKDVLRAAFDAAGLPAEIEVYAGALHGWCPPDSAVYHAAQAERAWERLLALFAQGLA